MTTVRDEPESNDASIEALLREVGARDEPSAAAASEVMSAVHAEWLAIVQQRRRQQRVVAWRLAAGVMLAVLVTTFAYRFMAPAPEQFGSIASVDGRLLFGWVCKDLGRAQLLFEAGVQQALSCIRRL